MEWNQEKTLSFIEDLKKKEILWNPRHPTYYHENEKENAWKELAARYEKPVKELQKKADSLKVSYWRAKKTCVAKQGRKKVYVSQWFAYESMQFLSDIDEPQQTIDTTSDDEDDTPTSSPTLSDVEGTSDLDERMEEHLEALRGKKRKRLQKRTSKRTNSRSLILIAAMLKYLREMTEASKDECATFGDYIAATLRTFDHHMRVTAEHNICNVMFEMQMSKYQQTPPPSTYNPHHSCQCFSSTHLSAHNEPSASSTPSCPPPQ